MFIVGYFIGLAAGFIFGILVGIGIKVMVDAKKSLRESNKYSLKQRSKKYDELYLRASKILYKFNPCKIENRMCIRGRNFGLNFCCNGCSNLSAKGCTVQSLFCRTWLCGTAAKALGKKYKRFNRLMTRIDNEAQKYGLYLYRAGKSECLELKPETAKISKAEKGDQYAGG